MRSSSVTRPASIHARRRLRENCGSAFASAASKRLPAAAGASVSVRVSASVHVGSGSRMLLRRRGAAGHVSYNRSVFVNAGTEQEPNDRWHLASARSAHLERARVPRTGRACRRCSAAAFARGLRPAARGAGRNRQLFGRKNLRACALGDGRRELYAGGQAVRGARIALSVRPLRAAGDHGVGVCELPRRRNGDRRRQRRSLHPHVSQSPERRLHVLPEGSRLFPRGPGVIGLHLRARSVRARAQVDA